MLPNTPIKLFFDVSAAVWLSTHYVIAKERGRVKEKITQNSLLLLLLGAWRCRFLCHNLYISYDVQVKWNLYINCNILLGDRKVSVLLGISFAFMLHVISIYWWYRNDDLLHMIYFNSYDDSFMVLLHSLNHSNCLKSHNCFALSYYWSDITAWLHAYFIRPL